LSTGSFVIARHVSAEAISHAPPGLPRFARNDNKKGRNGTPPSVIARSTSDEAISKSVAISLQLLADCWPSLRGTPPLCHCEARECRSNPQVKS